jgi:hypothetical protein
MSLTHVDTHVSEIVMVWIQSGDLLMVWIQISQKNPNEYMPTLISIWEIMYAFALHHVYCSRMIRLGL